MIKSIFNTITANNFFVSVITLMTGTAIAQAIPVLISPVLTRLYSPENFGVFALYLAIVSIFGVVSTGRYELAIMLPKKDDDAMNILIISLIMAFGISFLFLVLFLIFHEYILKILGNTSIALWLYFIPLSVLLTGLFQGLNYWNNRKLNYKSISIGKIVQTSGMSVIQVILGFFLFTNGGLIIGNIVGLFTGVLILLKFSNIKRSVLKLIITRHGLVKNALKYKSFPLISSFGALLDIAALQMPVFIITKFFSSSTTGFFSLTFKVLNLPMALISGAIAQVLFQKISVVYYEEPEKMYSLIWKTFFMLLTLTIPFIAVITIFGKMIFLIIFGEAWGDAGNYSVILCIAIAARFIVSPLSSVLALEHNIKKGVLWQTIYFISITVTLIISSRFYITTFLKIFVVHEIILYGLYFFIIIRATRVNNKSC